MTDNLSPQQFEGAQDEKPTPAITGSRRMYGTTSVYTEDHRIRTSSGFDVDVNSYHWHDGDNTTNYIEASGRMVKKDGTPGARIINSLRKPPPHVLDEMKRLRGEP